MNRDLYWEHSSRGAELCKDLNNADGTDDPAARRLFFSTRHTRELLKWLGQCHGPGDLAWVSTTNPRPIKFYATYEELKAELSKRPHVPNKPEGRAARRAAASRPQRRQLKYKRA